MLSLPSLIERPEIYSSRGWSRDCLSVWFRFLVKGFWNCQWQRGSLLYSYEFWMELCGSYRWPYKWVTEVSYSCNLYQWSFFTLLVIGDFGPTLIICYFYSSFQAEMIHVIGGWGWKKRWLNEVIIPPPHGKEAVFLLWMATFWRKQSSHKKYLGWSGYIGNYTTHLK